MRHLKYALLVILIGIGILDLAYVFFRRGYNGYFRFEQTRLAEIMNGNTPYDALFIGSSRTLYHINPKIIDSIMGVNSFNAGMDGANLLEINLILKCYLVNHPAPKYVVADVSTQAFDIEFQPFFNPNVYFPYLNNKIVFNTLEPYKHTTLLRYLPFLQITECDDFLREGAFLGLTGQQKPLAPHYKGYLESGKDTLPLPFKVKYLKTEYLIEKQGLDLLSEIINICKKHNIKLFITYSPVYKKKDEKMNPAFFPRLKSICDSTRVPFLNYRSIGLTNNNRLFRDEIHLNRYGAEIFSGMVARDIHRIVSIGNHR